MQSTNQTPNHSSAEGQRSSGGAPLILIGVLLIFVVCVIGGFLDLRRGIVSQNWPTTEGKVLSAHLLEDEEGYCGASVSYAYEVEGITYEGHDVHASEVHSGDGCPHAKATLDRYPVRKIVRVYYDPARPQAALLEPGADWDSISGTAFFFAFMAIVVALAMRGRSASKSEQTAIQ